MALSLWRRKLLAAFCASPLASLAFPAVARSKTDRARELHFSSIVLVTHSDTPIRLLNPAVDLGKRNVEGQIDVPRMRDGGLNCVFFSIYIDGPTMGSPAVQVAIDQIDATLQTLRGHPNDLRLCRTAAEIRRTHQQGKIAVLLAIEGGQMIASDLRVLRTLGTLGVRYMSLTHYLNDEWADSSTDKPAHDGLTAFGKSVVREMNRQGIIVDISHVSDKTFYDALEQSTAPMIASHSSCRALCDHPRNMSDQMIRDLASKGGVIQINFEKSYLDHAYDIARQKQVGELFGETDPIEVACAGDVDCYWRESLKLEDKLTRDGKLPVVSWERIIDHIDHVVQMVGADYVGLGTDFDGASMPLGMEDCSKLPRITEALLAKRYTDIQIRKILGLNVLRVMEQSQAVMTA